VAGHEQADVRGEFCRTHSSSWMPLRAAFSVGEDEVDWAALEDGLGGFGGVGGDDVVVRATCSTRVRRMYGSSSTIKVIVWKAHGQAPCARPGVRAGTKRAPRAFGWKELATDAVPSLYSLHTGQDNRAECGVRSAECGNNDRGSASPGSVLALVLFHSASALRTPHSEKSTATFR